MLSSGVFLNHFPETTVQLFSSDKLKKKKKLHFLSRSISCSPLQLLYDTHISAFIIHDAAVAPQPGPCDQARCKSMYILHSVTELDFSSRCSSQRFHSPYFHFLHVSLSYEKWNTKKKKKRKKLVPRFYLNWAWNLGFNIFFFFSFHNIWIAAKTGWWATERECWVFGLLSITTSFIHLQPQWRNAATWSCAELN